MRRLPRLAVAGQAVADMTHLVAELIENAAVFSPPHTAVRVHGEPVATGACVQAAAALHQTPPDEVATAWNLGKGYPVEPDDGVDSRAVRAAYAELRDRYYATS